MILGCIVKRQLQRKVHTTNFQNHMHPADPTEVERLKFFVRLKQAALGTDKPPRVLYEELTSGLAEELRRALPPRQKILMKISKQRQTERDKHAGTKGDEESRRANVKDEETASASYPQGLAMDGGSQQQMG